MTFVLDALHLTILEGLVPVVETTLTILIKNITGQGITFSKVSADGKVVTHTPITVRHGDTLTIKADAEFFGWNHADTIYWCIDYLVDDPVLYISKRF